MAFWGIEVEKGETFDVKIDKGRSLNLCQASLGVYDEERTTQQSVILNVIVDGKEFTIGTLDTKCLPTQSFNLWFVESFKISHDMTNGSVYFFGTIDTPLKPHRCASQPEVKPNKEEATKVVKASPPTANIEHRYEVKSGQTLGVKVAEGNIVCLLCAYFAKKRKKIHKNVYLHVSVDWKQLVAGNLNLRDRGNKEKLFLMFEKDFHISHTLSKGSLYIDAVEAGETGGYSTSKSDTDSDDDIKQEIETDR